MADGEAEQPRPHDAVDGMERRRPSEYTEADHVNEQQRREVLYDAQIGPERGAHADHAGE